MGESVTEKEYYEGVSEERKYAQGGKVEANNPYGWPSRDARNGGNS